MVARSAVVYMSRCVSRKALMQSWRCCGTSNCLSAALEHFMVKIWPSDDD